MRKGIFGGSFNPIHNMHLDIANYLIDNNILDEVIFVPTGNRYPKDSLISDLDRLCMVRLAVLENSSFKVSDYELSNSLVYTVETLEHFRNGVDDIFFVCGFDNLVDFDKWKRYEDILANYKIIAVRRGNFGVDDILNKYSKYRDNIIICDIDVNSISSTKIRNMIRNDEDVSQYVNNSVYEYIKKKSLYK